MHRPTVRGLRYSARNGQARLILCREVDEHIHIVWIKQTRKSGSGHSWNYRNQRWTRCPEKSESPVCLATPVTNANYHDYVSLFRVHVEATTAVSKIDLLLKPKVQRTFTRKRSILLTSKTREPTIQDFDIQYTSKPVNRLLLNKICG